MKWNSKTRAVTWKVPGVMQASPAVERDGSSAAIPCSAEKTRTGAADDIYFVRGALELLASVIPSPLDALFRLQIVFIIIQKYQ
jgi:hypothetical protein